VLRVYVGDEDFFQILKDWITLKSGESATTEEFLALAEDVSGHDLQQYAKVWLYGEVKPAAYPTKELVDVEGLTVAPAEKTVLLGATQALTATFVPEDATFQDVTWASDNNTVATVDTSGVVTAKKVGKAHITVTSVANPTAKAVATITVAETIEEDQAEIVRLSGGNRVVTSISISKEGWDKSENVVIANGSTFADSLIAGPVAYKLDAPILLTTNPKDGLEEAVIKELERLEAKNVTIVGGGSSVSDAIEAALIAAEYKVDRLSGGNRFTTATSVAAKLKELNGGTLEEAFLANANSFPDAIAASPVAALKTAPILYSSSGSAEVNSDTLAFLNSVEDLKTVNIVGGTSSIPESAEAQLKAAEYTVNRSFGGNRYTTAAALYTDYQDLFDGVSISLATGVNFPDALSGGVLAAKRRSPVLLVSNADAVNEDVKALIDSIAPEKVYIFGGESSVSPETIANYLK
jgi:putative cell wall-binding protein